GKLQDDPENDQAWNELSEAVTAPGISNDEVERVLGQARARHEQRREWNAVAKLLEFEISFAADTPVEAPMQAELARIFHEELVDSDRAVNAYRRLLDLRHEDPAALEALESDEAKRAKWSDLVSRYLHEAEGGDDAFKSSLYASAAEISYRYGGGAGRAEARKYVERAIALDRRSRRAASLGEIAYGGASDWEGVARCQAAMLDSAPQKDERVAAGLRLGRTAARRLNDTQRAIQAFQSVLDLA